MQLQLDSFVTLPVVLDEAGTLLLKVVMAEIYGDKLRELRILFTNS
jgi:hypothetical protein